MRIYYTASYLYTNKNHQLLKDLANNLKGEGNVILRRPFKPDNESTLNQNVGSVFEITTNDFRETHKALIRRIREADVVIAEVTEPSSSVGYEIAIAQAEKKPVLAIFNTSKTNHLPNFFQGNESKLFQVRAYNDAVSATKVSREFIEEAKKMIDTKFILIISPEIDKYLGWAADVRRMHKAQVVRNAVEDAMAKDKEYKAFLKSQGLD